MLGLVVTALQNVSTLHLVLEAVLVLVVIKLLFFNKRYNPSEREKLTPQEEQQLIDEWEPEPLVSGTTVDYTQPPVCEGAVGTHTIISGRDVLNLASFNFLGLVGNPDIEQAAIDCIRKYGVGSCGPRGFYGTIDVHLMLEERLAKFMACEEAIIYSYGFSTIASVIPAYSKRGDIIFYDKGVGFAIQQGLIASRSLLIPFDHNNIEQLEALMEEQDAKLRKNKQKDMATRRFLVVEGLYANYGDVCPLKELVRLKYKYKVRLIVEESMSFGVLGKTGRGVTEHFGVPVVDVDMIVSTMSNALSSVGGFCVGRSFVVDHQRLSAQGYCFSASLPPLLAASAMKALDFMESDGASTLTELRSNAKKLRELFSKIPLLDVNGDDFSPLIHLTKRDSEFDTVYQVEDELQQIVDQCLSSNVAFTRAKYIRKEEKFPPPPSIRVAVSARHTLEELQEAASVLRKAVAVVLQGTSIDGRSPRRSTLT